MSKTWLFAIAAVLGAAALPLSAQSGWAVGDGGTILHTSDGGATWSPQTSGTGTVLNSVSFVDANNGWAVGLAGVIVHTTNGGTTWSPQTSFTLETLDDVSFVDVNNGWAVGDSGTIVHTSNGGTTWSPQTTGTGANLFGVSFVDANNGWAVGIDGTILHTSDGGATWSPQTSGTGIELFGVSFVDANNGWAVGGLGTIVHTGNGGATWSPQISGTGTSIFTGTSPLTTNGNICANVYVFDAVDEQEIACCSCLLTPNQGANITIAQLVANVFEATAPSSIVVKLIATAAGAATSCTPTTAAGGSGLPGTGVASAALANAMVATGTHIHVVGGTIGSGLTETPFTPATLSTWELLRASVLCGFIVGNLSGGNICPGCAPGVAGAVRK